MKKIIVIFLYIILLTFTSGCFEESDLNMKCDNNISVDVAVNRVYSKSDIDILQEELYTRKITYDELKDRFEIECIRKTFQGYYIVLNLETNCRGFLFLNNNLELYKILKVDKFYNKSDFDFIKPKLTTFDFIVNFDKNTIPYPISYICVSGHILSDGCIIILYDRVVDGKLLDDPLVKSVEFMNNEEILNNADDFWVQNTPYILPMDKVF